MIWIRISMCFVELVLGNAPLYFDDTDLSLRVLRNAGYEIEGRDQAPGFCGIPLLPANKEPEVYYITLPDSRWNPRQLQQIKNFDNLQTIRSQRPATSEEYQMLKELAGDTARVIVSRVRE